MKNLQSVLPIFLLLVFVVSKANAQSLPLLSGKTIKVLEQPKVTIIPPKFTPTQEVPPGNEAADRKVFWIHGHGGGIGSWARVSATTQSAQVPAVLGYPPRKITSHNMDYSGSPHSVSSAAALLKTNIENIAATQPQLDKNRNVAIAHSLGGLVSQYVDYLYDTQGEATDRSFYGLITVGTPNQGAPLSKNVYPFPGSKGEQFAKNTANKLLAGPIMETIENSFLLDLIWSGSGIQKKVKSFTDDYLSEISLVLLKDFNTTVALDLQPGSAVINLLQGHNPEISRRIAIHSKLSNTDMIWKTYHYLRNPPNGENPFGADNAQQSVDKMNANKGKYKNKVDFWQNEEDYWQGLLPWCWLGGAVNCLIIKNKRDEAIDIKNSWQTGLNWWNDANDQWRHLSGDLTLVSNPQGSCMCTNYNVVTQEKSGPYSNPVSDCTNQFYYPIARECSFQVSQTWEDVETDGIVPQSSQAALPGAIKTYEMVGDSHFQEVNSPRLMKPLTFIWDGVDVPFFKTDKR